MVVGTEDMARLERAAHAREAWNPMRAGCLAAREAAERIDVAHDGITRTVASNNLVLRFARAPTFLFL